MTPYLDVDMEHVAVRQAPKGRYAMYGGLTQLPDGEVFCVFKVGSLHPKTGSPWTVRDETIVWTQSSDKGHTWPQAEHVIYKDGATRQENCCGRGYRAKDGTIIHPFYILNADYEERAQPQNWSRIHLAITRDEGQTWATPKLEQPLPMGASFGGFVPLDDGTVLLNIYGTAKLNTFRHVSAVMRSADDGKTWTDYTIIGDKADPDGGTARLNETSIAQMPSGRLVSWSRTQYDGFPIYQGISTDRGKTWSVQPNGLTGLCPALAASKSGPPEGTVVAVWHDRWGQHANKGGVHVAFSTDEAATWGEPMWISGGAYPCVLEVEPGKMFTTYYQSNSLLRGTFFPVPFPTGLRAEATPDGLKVQWDAYRGAKAKDYAYHVHRSTEAAFEPTEANRVGVVREADAFTDAAAQSGTVHFYKVVAIDGERRVGASWTAAARAD